VHWYRNMFSHVPSIKVREIAAMLKAIHASEDLAATRERSRSLRSVACVWLGPPSCRRRKAAPHRRHSVASKICEHRVAEGPAGERCHHRVSQGRAPLN
jgi:hypothetical protein